MKWLTVALALCSSGVLAAPVLNAANSKCALGTVERVRPRRGELVVSTASGPLTLRYAPGTVVSKPGVAVAQLRPGQAVRTYFVLNDGALATRIELR